VATFVLANIRNNENFVWGFLYLLTATREATAIPPWGISSWKVVTTTIQEMTRTETTMGTMPDAGIGTIVGNNKLAKRGIQDGIRGSEITNIWRTEIGDDGARAQGNGRRGSGIKQIQWTVI
jgi:hypothetical protein